MLFQEVIPDTSGYMFVGYAFFFTIMAIYLISFFVRSRNLNQDLSMLESMKQESPSIKAPSVKPARPKTSRPKPAAAKTRKKK